MDSIRPRVPTMPMVSMSGNYPPNAAPALPPWPSGGEGTLYVCMQTMIKDSLKIHEAGHDIMCHVQVMRACMRGHSIQHRQACQLYYSSLQLGTIQVDQGI